jgi:putative ABC transport system substrate-binding protein
VRRREFIGAFGGAAAWPLAGHAQQPERLRRVGVLMPWPEDQLFTRARVAAFAEALARLGWIEGRNIRTDYRFAAGDVALLKTYAAELVGMSPDIILANTGPGLAAVRQQTRTIAIVFVIVGDPVGQGYVQSLARPGGNITGFATPDWAIKGKWLQLFKEVAPRVIRARCSSTLRSTLSPHCPTARSKPPLRPSG